MWRSARALGITLGVVLGLSTAVSAAVARRAAALTDTPAHEPEDGLTPVRCGGLPGWVTDGAGGSGRWAVFLPGLGSHPLRHQSVASVFTEHGDTVLFASHSARRPARRHAFGVRERHEALAWIRYAADHGATEVVLLGWSFGASLWLHAVTAPLPVPVRALVLTGPLVDWTATIAHGVDRGGVTGRIVARAAAAAVALPVLCRIAGQRAPRSLRPASAPVGAGSSGVPVLVVVHGAADATVPLSTSRRLVDGWPGEARLHIVEGAWHGAERDTDPTGWVDAVRLGV